MKKIIICFFLHLIAFNVTAQITINCFEIIGKGNSGQFECSGHIIEELTKYDILGSINISLSDMLEVNYNITRKEQIDERTIKYHCSKTKIEFDENGKLINQSCYIIKQKCNINKDIYFFMFPPLYKGHNTTIYKTKKIY